MHLTDEQAQQFYDIWLPLMGYVHSIKYPNREGKIGLDKMNEFSKDIYEDVSLIDDYIEDNPQLYKTDKEILRSWKNIKYDYFFVYNHLKKGSIFIPYDESEDVYLVSGIYDSIAEILQSFTKPVLCETALLPFLDKIIINGILLAKPITFGPNIKKSLKDRYDKAKKYHSLKTTLY